MQSNPCKLSYTYRQNRSTQTALLQMYDRWVRAASQGQVSGVILIDLSAAFDLVDSGILIQKLRIYGLKDDILSWVLSYLTDKHQTAWIDHVYSDFTPYSIGLPQGSVLGHLLFLIYYNDDSTMTVTGKSVKEVSAILAGDGERVVDWTGLDGQYPVQT